MRSSINSPVLPECPITLQAILDPVRSASQDHSGLVYEREAVEEWINEKKSKGEPVTCPLTRAPLSHPLLPAKDYLKQVESLGSEHKKQWLSDLYLVKRLDRLPLLTKEQKNTIFLRGNCNSAIDSKTPSHSLPPLCRRTIIIQPLDF